ncbi:putative lipid II flippase FtsW [Algiphilus sp.]|uniref:putative lipid II flippase FtsW n=1 Tax=Algiphilus sp. TaxID=1872431 RepID=UPI002A612031|nr:putative lipid II flippase FtsW [Pseudomonadota bacterium]
MIRAPLAHYASRTPMPDRWLAGLAVTLLLLGLVMVASSSVAVAEQSSGGALTLFWKQMVYAALGVFVAATLMQIPLAAFAQNGMLLLGVAFVLLLLVLVPGIGVEINSARRWIDLGPVNLQASEPARLAIVLYLAGFIVRRQLEVQHQFRGLLKPLLVIALACALLLLQPDFGAAVILAGISFLMLFLGGVKLRYLVAPVLLTVGAFAVLAITQPYRLRRLLGFSDPWQHVESAGWQLSQSLIAIGRGGWFGEGLGNSLQKMLYLPEQHTDFIFAVYAEEFGLLGVLVILALYIALWWRGVGIAAEAEARGARFAAYLGYALSYWLAFQVLVNMAVNMGLLPTKGLTLPLMSYGGSSLLTVCAMVGLLLRIDVENRAAAPASADDDSRRRVSREGVTA